MRPILERIIHPSVSTFISDCAIHNNVLVAHKIINKFKNMKGKKRYVAIKLDMEEAYDRIKWDFICKCLQEMGFHEQ